MLMSSNFFAYKAFVSPANEKKVEVSRANDMSIIELLMCTFVKNKEINITRLPVVMPRIMPPAVYPNIIIQLGVDDTMSSSTLF